MYLAEYARARRSSVLLQARADQRSRFDPEAWETPSWVSHHRRGPGSASPGYAKAVVNLAHTGQALHQLLGQHPGIAAVHGAGQGHRAARDLDLDVGGVEL